MRDDRRRIDALRQSIEEAARQTHRAVEIVAVQDAARPVREPELATISRGIELLGKAAWMLNERRISGEYRSARCFGHDLTRLLEAIDDQAESLSVPPVLDDQVVREIVGAATTFAEGGRYDHLDGIATGESFLPPHLVWNGVQMRTTSAHGSFEEQFERTLLLREMHTSSLQRFERTLATHLVLAQQDLWQDVVLLRDWLTTTSRRRDEALGVPIPQQLGPWSCSCAGLDRAVAVWTPVTASSGTGANAG
jgi:hypothetical protein